MGGGKHPRTSRDPSRCQVNCIFHFSHILASRITIPIALQNMQICGQGNPPHTASPRSGSPGQLFGNCLPSKTVLAPGLRLQCQMPVESIVNCHKNSIENIEKIYVDKDGEKTGGICMEGAPSNWQPSEEGCSGDSGRIRAGNSLSLIGESIRCPLCVINGWKFAWTRDK